MNKHFVHFCQAAALSVALALGSSGIAQADDNSMVVAESGIIKVRSAYSKAETIARLKQDIAAKGIRFFDEIDHTALGASADLPINRSKLLLFGNPPLGVQFLQSNPLAGLDWPVRMLVTQDDAGQVWVSWSDFRFVANRYQLTDRDAQIAMASEVAASIASSTRK